MIAMNSTVLRKVSVFDNHLGAGVWHVVKDCFQGKSFDRSWSIVKDFNSINQKMIGQQKNH